MLTKMEKIKVVDAIKEDVAKAQAIFLTNLVGVTSNTAVSIRKEVREAKGKIVITKNTLFAKAVEGTEYEELLTGLVGPNAIAFAFDDPAAVAKCLKNANKESEIVTLKGAFCEGKLLKSDEVKALAELPSRDQMLGTLLATFMAPISSFARTLNEIKLQKEGGTEVAEAKA
ncbi:MAG: 50S ribosomal protein L10 [Bacteriovoracaceae bacterium]|nr:50S ribosomal protein L10 [Bacteriovoracaceae bacterium]